MIIGITGGVGAGKSTVIGYMTEKYDCFPILADDVARDLQAKGQPVYKEIVDWLGDKILGDDGEIDRGKLFSTAFADKSGIARLNEIVHPAVRVKIEQMIADNVNIHAHIALEAALLVEAHYEDVYDELWYIKSSEDVRIDRLHENRGYTKEKSLSIINNQLKDYEYEAAADYVVVNDGDIESLFDQIDKRLTQ